jgi:tetratricopeptide (TPR) repeat protein/glycosyltransferase involved in cell wall biosynthesis
MTNVLLLATAWGPRHGGINAFNHDFAIGLKDVLANNGSVYCAVLRPTREDRENAGDCGVILIDVDRDPSSDRYDPAWALEIRDKLRQEHGNPLIDWWVGHDLISTEAALRGREAANYGGVAAVKHTSQFDFKSRQYGRGSRAIEPFDKQVDLFNRADRHFGVGPLLTGKMRDQLNASDAVMLVPGFPESIEGRPPATGLVLTTFGRMDRLSDRIKQGSLAVAGLARACREARKVAEKQGQGSSLAGNPAIQVIGITEGASEEENALRRIADERCRGLNVIPLPFDEDRQAVLNRVRRSNIALMLSTHEGFGLTGWEAVAAGTPLIVGEDSGLFQLISASGGEEDKGRVLAIRVEGTIHAEAVSPFTEADEERAAQAIARVANDLTTWRAKAEALRTSLVQRYGCTWKDTAKTFLDALGEPPSSRTGGEAGNGPRHEAPPALIRMPGLPAFDPATSSPRLLLLPESGVVPFHAAREALVQEVIAWAEEANLPVGLRLDVGAGGAGKTRLMLEVCRRLNQRSNWFAGFLHTDQPLDLACQKLLAAGRNAFVVVDYAETRPKDVVTLVSTARHSAAAGRTVRFALLARAAGDWWRRLDRHAGGDPGLVAVLTESRTKRGAYRLDGAKLEPDERKELYATAAGVFAEALNRSAPAETSELTEDYFGEPLYVLTAALAAVEGDGAADSRGLQQFLLRRERDYWRRLLLDRDLGDKAVDLVELALAHVTLVGGTDSAEKTRALLARTPRVRTLDEGKRDRIIDVLRELYPRAGGIAALGPDLLGERLVAEALDLDDGLLDAALGPNAPDADVAPVLTVLERLAAQDAEAASWLDRAVRLAGPKRGKQVVAVAEQGQAQLTRRLEVELATSERGKEGNDLLRALRNAADANSVDVRPLMALALATQLRRDERHSSVKWKTSEARKRIKMLLQLARLRTDLFVFDGATEAAEEASDLARRALGRSKLDLRLTFEAEFVLTVALQKIGRFTEALEAAQRANRLARDKVFDATPVELARTLNNYSVVLDDLGRYDEALKPAKEGLALLRVTRARQPDAYAADLAGSLDNLANHLEAVGHYDEALKVAKECLALRRELHAQQPDAGTADLPSSLHNLANHLSAVGHYDEALKAVKEGVALLRELHARQPDAYAANLGLSLDNLASRLSAVGHYDEALKAAKEGLALLREPHARQPDAYAADLARSLHNLANHLEAVGHYDETLKAAKEGLALVRELHARQPDAYAALLASSLDDLGNHFDAVGRYDEALEAAGGGLALRRELHARQPDAYVADLARSLGNLANHLDSVGQYDEALKAGEEALDRLDGRLGPEVGDLRAYAKLVRCNARIGLGEAAEGLVEAQEAVAAFAASTSRNSDRIMARVRARVAAARAASAALSPNDAFPIVAEAWADVLARFRERPVVFSRELARLLPLVRALDGGGRLEVPDGLDAELAAADASLAVMMGQLKES